MNPYELTESPYMGSGKDILFSHWIYRIIRIMIAAIFLWSGISKLLDLETFAVIVKAYGLLPRQLLIPAVIGLPALEVIAGIGLAADIRGSLSIIAGMMILFMAVLIYGIWLGLDIDCGCFGPEDPEAKAFHGLRTALFRDMMIMAGIVYLYAWRYVRSVRPIRLNLSAKM